jgi:hypothetical protein
MRTLRVPQLDRSFQELLAIGRTPTDGKPVPQQVVLPVGAHEFRAIGLENPLEALPKGFLVGAAEELVGYVEEQPFKIVGRRDTRRDRFQILTKRSARLASVARSLTAELTTWCRSETTASGEIVRPVPSEGGDFPSSCELPLTRAY